MKCVLKYPKKENTKRPEPTNNFDSGRILSIVFYFYVAFQIIGKYLLFIN